MPHVKDWSKTASENTQASPVGISGNEPVVNIDNWGRNTMAAVRTTYEDLPWLDINHIPTYVSANSFTVPTDLTATYRINRRVRVKDSAGGIFYGTVTASSYSDPNTTITIALDSGALNANINLLAFSPIDALSFNGYYKNEVYSKGEVDGQISTNTINRPISIANNATDPANDIDFGVGTFGFDDFSGKATATAMTKRLDANWVAGTNQGGLDANSKLANTWYHCFAIYNPTTSTADFLFSTSFNSPVLPSGYTKKKYVWSVLTDVNNNLSPFVQIENYNQWSLFPTDVYVNGGVANRSVRSPYGFKARVKIIVHGAESRLLLSPNFNGLTFEVGAQATGSFGDEYCSYGIPAETLTNTSSQISAGGSSRQYGAYPSYGTLGWYNPFYN